MGVQRGLMLSGTAGIAGARKKSARRGGRAMRICDDGGGDSGDENGLAKVTGGADLISLSFGVRSWSLGFFPQRWSFTILY